MRIKKIEISGFKSFADREVVYIDDHVTAVIGPNGCGKSNIVDAMRWCLGEQRAKHLRGTGMSDVIFAGCSTRGPGNAAEVTLWFENRGEVPIAYLNYAEIAVTRRLLRDGTSEYLINKVQCRLRDIQELMTGTGAGTRGYSIIEQGQVGQIVSSKPDERRYFIDEAAGITRFKAQKQAAETKIQQTEQNLQRVRDVLGELEGRLGNLRRQAQKAERYKRYRAELRGLDLWMASHRFLELTMTAQVLATRRDVLGEHTQALRSSLASHEARGEAIRLEVTTAEQALTSHQQLVFDLENRSRLAETEAAYQRREQDSLAAAASQARAEASALAGSLAHLETELAQVRDEYATILDQGDAGYAEQTAALQAEHDELSGRLRRESHAFEQNRMALSRLQAREASLTAQVGARVEGLADLEQRLTSLAEETELLQIQVERGTSDLEFSRQALAVAAGEVADLAAMRAELDRERQALRPQLKAAEAAIDAARAELAQVRSRAQSLEEIQARFRGCAGGVQVVMAHREQLAVLGIFADQITAPAELEQALSAVLGDRLQGVLVADPSAGAAGVDLLKAKQEGRTVFLPQAVRDDPASPPPQIPVAPGVRGRLRDLIEIQPEFRPLAGALLGETLVVETLSQALELWHRGDFAGPVVTYDGDRIEASGVVVGGSAKGLDSALLQQKREIRELHAQAELLAAKVADKVADLQAVQDRQAALEAERERSEATVLAAETTRLTREQEIRRIEQEVRSLQQRIDHSQRERDKLAANLTTRRDDGDRLQRELAEIHTQIPTLEETTQTAEVQLETLRSQQTEVAAGLTEARVALARYQQQRDALAQATARLERQVAGEQARLEKLHEVVATNEAKIVELGAQAAAASTLQAQLAEEHQTASEALASLRAAYDAVRVVQTDVELALRTVRGELDGQREVLGEVELGLKELQLERQHLQDDARERFDVDLEEVLIDHHTRSLASAADVERQKELKRILARMGEVNLTAIDEYEEVATRVEYLSGQKQDLESAISQLQEAIDKINRTTRERFNETFKAVNEMFQQVFPRLFSGGQASLKLTDPSDILGTGVEIAAQPPGKQVRSLELLSGGEKALTAVSLIFAIFLIKPSPFCLLDEVDAPLDEANVGRFGAMVAEMAQTTQFIIITHNKRTMEIADRLYGVTMEVRGVSKLVSVNLRRAVEMAVA